MTVSLDALSRSRSEFGELFRCCEEGGFPMRPYFVVRDPWAQARLWRQSRSLFEIEAGMRALRGAGAPWLARIISSVGPQFGRWATNASPGNSWHQWGEAVDAYALVDGRVCWETAPGSAGGDAYRLYAETALEVGLTPLGPAIGDWVHVQARAEGAPSRLMSWPEIDAEMRRRFGS